MDTKRASAKHVLFFIAATMLFGSSGVVASTIPLPSSEVCLVRLLVAAAAMAVIFLVSHQSMPKGVSRREYLFVIVSGICLGLCMTMLFEAYRLVGVGLGAILCATAPVITMALSPILFGERLHLPVVIGFAIVLGGLVLLNLSAFEGAASVPGMLLGLGAAACTASMVIFNKLARHISGIPCTTIQLGSAFLVTVLTAGAGEGFAFIATIPAATWPTILVFGGVFTALAYFLYYRAIDLLPVQTVSVCAYVEPLTAVVMGSLLLGEAMAPVQIAGALCIIGGALLGEAHPKVSPKQRRNARRAYVLCARAWRRRSLKRAA